MIFSKHSKYEKMEKEYGIELKTTIMHVKMSHSFWSIYFAYFSVHTRKVLSQTYEINCFRYCATTAVVLSRASRLFFLTLRTIICDQGECICIPYYLCHRAIL